MAKVLTAEIGHSVIKVVEMNTKKGKKPHIDHFVEIPVPEDCVSDGYINENRIDELAKAFRAGLNENGLTTNRIIYTVSSGKIINREVSIPPVKENALDSMIQNNIKDYFPVDLGHHEISYSVLETIESGEDKGKRRVLVMAAELELIDQYRKLSKAAGLELVNLVYGGDAVFLALQGRTSSETEAVIKIEERTTLVTIIKNGKLLLQRSIGVGIAESIRELAGETDFLASDYSLAWKAIKREDYTSDLRSTLQPLAGSISRVIDFYNSHSGDNGEVEVMSLIGMGTDFEGLGKFLSAELGLRQKVISNLDNVAIRSSHAAQNASSFMSPIGAGLSTTGFVHDRERAAEAARNNYRTGNIVLSITFTAAALALLFLAFMPYNDAKVKNEDLQDQKQKYAEGEKVYNEYISMSQTHQYIEYGASLTHNSNDEILNFLAELEEKFPANAIITEFASDDDAAAMRIQVLDKDSAAYIADALRGFDSVIAVTITEMHEKDDTIDVPADDDEEGWEAYEAAGLPDADSLEETPNDEGYYIDEEERIHRAYFEFDVACTYMPSFNAEPQAIENELN